MAYDEGAKSDLDQGVLQGFTNRINEQVVQLQEIGLKLNHHADEVSGELPGKVVEDAPTRACRYSGKLGNIENSLNALDEAISYIAQAAGRNCTLA